MRKEIHEQLKNKDTGELIQEAEKARVERMESFKREERGLRLMEAGLKERPLDRDFYEMMKMRYTIRKERFDKEIEVFAMIKEIHNKRGSGGDDS